MKGHQKHAKLEKPSGGRFHRNEFAVIGAPCGVIQDLCGQLANELNEFKVGFADADHGIENGIRTFERQYTDKIGYHQISFDDSNIEYSFRSLFNDSDLAIINGNHFTAGNQIVLINQKKKDSLQKKLDRLTNVLLFVLDEGETEIHEYLKSDFSNIPVVPIANLKAIASTIRGEIKEPTLKGLVLAGGESLRMGEDKGNIDYHGKPQKEYAAELLSEFCSEVYLSMRDDSGKEKYPVITDKFVGLGPYGGILSAFQSDPNAAWLVVATDIPLLDRATLQELTENRNSSKLGTCFHNPETSFPEPLITIWEPRAYHRLLSFLSLGYSCPRKGLINSDVEELHLERTEVLKNANTPEERKEMEELMK